MLSCDLAPFFVSGVSKKIHSTQPFVQHQHAFATKMTSLSLTLPLDGRLESQNTYFRYHWGVKLTFQTYHMQNRNVDLPFLSFSFVCLFNYWLCHNVDLRVFSDLFFSFAPTSHISFIRTFCWIPSMHIELTISSSPFTVSVRIKDAINSCLLGDNDHSPKWLPCFCTDPAKILT